MTREKVLRRQTSFVQYHTSAPLAKNRLLIWVVRFATHGDIVGSDRLRCLCSCACACRHVSSGNLDILLFVLTTLLFGKDSLWWVILLIHI